MKGVPSMNNKEIELLLKDNHIYKWQIAKELGIHESTFVKWFREELSQDKQEKIIVAVENIKLNR